MLLATALLLPQTFFEQHWHKYWLNSIAKKYLKRLQAQKLKDHLQFRLTITFFSLLTPHFCLILFFLNLVFVMILLCYDIEL